MPERILGLFCDVHAEPDYKQIIEKSLGLFAIFTGVTLSFYVKEFLFGTRPQGFANFSFASRTCIVAAVTALLLRYIVGSAVHLNARYVPTTASSGRLKDEQQNILGELVLTNRAINPPDRFRWLLSDTFLLAVFGVLAVAITYSQGYDDLMARSGYFIGAGLLWGITAWIWRRNERPIAERWIIIDAVQLAITLVMIFLPLIHRQGENFRTGILAAVYLGCLLLDFLVISRPPRTSLIQ